MAAVVIGLATSPCLAFNVSVGSNPASSTAVQISSTPPTPAPFELYSGRLFSAEPNVLAPVEIQDRLRVRDVKLLLTLTCEGAQAPHPQSMQATLVGFPGIAHPRKAQAMALWVQTYCGKCGYVVMSTHAVRTSRRSGFPFFCQTRLRYT